MRRQRGAGAESSLLLHDVLMTDEEQDSAAFSVDYYDGQPSGGSPASRLHPTTNTQQQPPLSPERLNLAQQQQYRAAEQQQLQQQRLRQQQQQQSFANSAAGGDGSSSRNRRQTVDRLMEELDAGDDAVGTNDQQQQGYSFQEFSGTIGTSTTDLRSSSTEHHQSSSYLDRNNNMNSNKVDSLLSELDRSESYNDLNEAEAPQQQQQQQYQSLLDQDEDPSLSTRQHSSSVLEIQSTSLTMDQPQPPPPPEQQQPPLLQQPVIPPPSILRKSSNNKTHGTAAMVTEEETNQQITTTPATNNYHHYSNSGPMSPFSPLLHRKKRPRSLNTTATNTVGWKDDVPRDLSLSICRKVSVVVTVADATSSSNQQQQQPPPEDKCLFPLKDSPRDLIVVNPKSLGGSGVPLTMDTARILAEKASDSNTTDWARTYRFHQVIWSSRADNATAAGGAEQQQQQPRNYNINDNEALHNIAQAVINDLSAPGSIAHRLLVGLQGSSSSSTTTKNNNKHKQLPMKQQLFGTVGNQSVARVFSAPQHKLSAAEIMKLYGLVGLIANGLLQQHQQQHVCTLSVLEIHEEEVLYDLLSSKPFARSREPVKIRYGAGGATVTGLSETPLESLKHVGHLLRRAFSAAVHPNRRARRGHVVVTLARSDKREPLRQRTSCLFVDLASSVQEDQDPSGSIQTSDSAALSHYNVAVRRSISALGSTLHAALLNEAGNDTPISYRDTLLTKALQKSMVQTDSRVIVLASVSPAVSQYEETLSTLRYANRLLHQPGQPLQSPFKSSKDSSFHDSVSSPITTASTEPISLDQFEGQQQSVLLQELISDPRQRLARLLRPSISASAEVNEDGLEPDGYRPTEYFSPMEQQARDYLNALREAGDYEDGDKNPHHSYDEPTKDDPPVAEEEEDESFMPTPLARNGSKLEGGSAFPDCDDLLFVATATGHADDEEELMVSPIVGGRATTTNPFDDGYYFAGDDDEAAPSAAVDQSRTLDDMAAHVVQNQQRRSVSPAVEEEEDNDGALQDDNFEHEHYSEPPEEYANDAGARGSHKEPIGYREEKLAVSERGAVEVLQEHEQHRLRLMEKNVVSRDDGKRLSDQAVNDLQGDSMRGAPEEHPYGPTDARDLTEEVSLLSSRIDGSFDACYPPVAQNQPFSGDDVLEDILREPDDPEESHSFGRRDVGTEQRNSSDQALENLLRDTESIERDDDEKALDNLLHETGSDVSSMNHKPVEENSKPAAGRHAGNDATARTDGVNVGSETGSRASTISSKRQSGCYSRESRIPKLQQSSRTKSKSVNGARGPARVQDSSADEIDEDPVSTGYKVSLQSSNENLQSGIAADSSKRSLPLDQESGNPPAVALRSAFSPIADSTMRDTQHHSQTVAQKSEYSSSALGTNSVFRTLDAEIDSAIPRCNVADQPKANSSDTEEKKADSFSRAALDGDHHAIPQNGLNSARASVSTATQSLKPVESFDFEPIDTRNSMRSRAGGKDALEEIEQLQAAVDKVKQTNITVWQSSLSSIENLRKYQCSQQEMVERLLLERDEANSTRQQLKVEMERRSEQHRLEMQSEREKVENAQLEIEKIRVERSEVVKICEEAIGTQAELEERVTELEQDLAERDDYYELAEMLAQLEQKLKDTEEELLHCRSDLEDREVTISELKFAIESFEADRDQLDENRSRLQNEVESLKRSLKNAQEFEKQAQRSQAEVSRLQNEIHSIEFAAESRESDFLQELRTKDELAKQFKQESESAQMELSVVRDEYQTGESSRREEIDRLKQELLELQEALAESLEKARESEERVVALDITEKELSKDLELTREELNRRISDVRELSSNLKELLSEREKDKEQIEDMEQTLATVQSEARERVEKLVRNQKEAPKLLEKTVKENCALVQTNKKLREAVEELQHVRVDAEAREMQLSEASTRLESVIEEKTSLEDDNERLKRELDDILRDHMASSTEYSKTIEALQRERDEAKAQEEELAATARQMDIMRREKDAFKEDSERLKKDLEALRRDQDLTSAEYTRSVEELRRGRLEAEAREQALAETAKRMEKATRGKHAVDEDNERLVKELDALRREHRLKTTKYNRSIDELRRDRLAAEDRVKELSEIVSQMETTAREKDAVDEHNKRLKRELDAVRRDQRLSEAQQSRTVASQTEVTAKERLALEGDNKRLKRELDSVRREQRLAAQEYSRSMEELRKRVLSVAEEREKKLANTSIRLKSTVQEKESLEQENQRLSREVQNLLRDRKAAESECSKSADELERWSSDSEEREKKLSEITSQLEKTTMENLALEEANHRLSMELDDLRRGRQIEFAEDSGSGIQRRNVGGNMHTRVAAEGVARSSIANGRESSAEIAPTRLGFEASAARFSRQSLYNNDAIRTNNPGRVSSVERSDLNRAEEVAAYLALSAKSRAAGTSNTNTRQLQQALYDLEDAKDDEINALKSRIKALERRLNSG